MSLNMEESITDLPDSPCIGVCSTLFDEICQGCGRTAHEVSHWVFLSAEQKQIIWQRIIAEGTAKRFR
jgi:predicted Fe-S protein YdhL (DUF1289 family)